VAQLGTAAAVALAVAWAAVAVLMLARPVFITHDSLSNNAHIWWIADRLWSGDGIPWRMALLARGEALTFPYGSVPWTTAALLWPLLGDRVVGLWLVLGAAGTIGATFWALPELRRGWWAAAVLANPALVIAPLLGQLPFLWATAATLAAVGCWRRGWSARAAVAALVAQVVHPAIALPVVAGLVALRLRSEPAGRRHRLLAWWSLSVALSLPAVAAVFASPVLSESSVAAQLDTWVRTTTVRSMVVLIPVALAAARHRVRIPDRVPALLTVAFLVAQWPMYAPFGMNFGWGALTRDRPEEIVDFVAAGEVRPGAVHRVLSGFDGKYGLYAVMRAGGVLDAEFFPEGLHRSGFPSPDAYAAFLRDRGVQRVVLFPSYDRRFATNEPELLRRMAGRGCVAGTEVRRLPTHRSARGRWAVFEVSAGC
jgi:hypothetical protein